VGAALDLELQGARERIFNPRSRAFLQNPYDTYKRLREEQPLYFNAQTKTWTAMRYRDMHVVLRDPRFGRDQAPWIEALHGAGAAHEPAFRNLLQTMLMVNDPDHGRLRALVNGSFNAKRVLGLKPAIARIAHDLVDRLPACGEVELMHDFARALPVVVICELLGIPERDRQRFIDERAVSERVFQPIPMTREELDDENRRFLALREFFLPLCEEKRRHPAEDLISDLVAAQAEGKLSEEELIAMIWLTFSAGHDTTVNLIGNAMVALHQHPAQLALLRARRELLPQAIDELLRYDSSVQAAARHVLEEVELSGERLRPGERVMCVLGSANRDPEVYADPDRLDITRGITKPVAFGGGIHFCLGAQLARIEGQIALGVLLSRLPDLTLPELHSPDWSASVILRGLETLPVRYSRRVDAHIDFEAMAHPSGDAAPAGRCPFH
jgi:cytochrome P450